MLRYGKGAGGKTAYSMAKGCKPVQVWGVLVKMAKYYFA